MGGKIGVLVIISPSRMRRCAISGVTSGPACRTLAAVVLKGPEDVEPAVALEDEEELLRSWLLRSYLGGESSLGRKSAPLLEVLGEVGDVRDPGEITDRRTGWPPIVNEWLGLPSLLSVRGLRLNSSGGEPASL